MNLKQLGMYVGLAAVTAAGVYQGLNDLEKITAKPAAVKETVPERVVKFQVKAPAYK
tara:strand:- start:3630 stop:3800 length:171 start_codon:yes stop_codon:yes gene_type:complete